MTIDNWVLVVLTLGLCACVLLSCAIWQRKRKYRESKCSFADEEDIIHQEDQVTGKEGMEHIESNKIGPVKLLILVSVS